MFKDLAYRSRSVKVLLALYGGVVLILIILAVSNYPVQWRVQVNHERQRYVEVIAQALRYYTADHSGTRPALPLGPIMIANADSCLAYCPALSQELPCYDLSKVLVPGYMKEMLRDPLTTSKQESGFYLRTVDNEPMIGACNTFFGQKIEVPYSSG